jgi:hypothetical protein
LHQFHSFTLASALTLLPHAMPSSTPARRTPVYVNVYDMVKRGQEQATAATNDSTLECQ